VNRLHHWYCNREAWKRHVREELVPAAADGVDLSGEVLEVGPGFGPATEVLVRRARRLTALEIDPALAGALGARLSSVEVVEGSGTAMPFPEAAFDAVVCFTMLHHVPSPADQDRLFAEAHRVLRPGAAFAGTDSLGRGLGFALLHIGDTKVLIDPQGLGSRLSAAGFDDIAVDSQGDSFRFRARRAAPAEPGTSPSY
jgi:SAM-dependent methyltransferase